jgi:hypothetical protein
MPSWSQIHRLQRSNQLHPDMPETLYDLGKSALNLPSRIAETRHGSNFASQAGALRIASPSRRATA